MCPLQTAALTLALSRGERGLTEVFLQATPTCATEPNSSFESPPICSLSPLGERGLTEVFLQATPTCATEPNSSFERPPIGSLSPSPPWGRGLG
jgi:hypothetical protein